jgi:hypothetical protein
MSLNALSAVASVGLGSSVSAVATRPPAAAAQTPDIHAVTPVNTPPRPAISRGQDVYDRRDPFDALPGSIPFDEFLLARRLIHRAQEPRALHETGALLPDPLQASDDDNHSDAGEANHTPSLCTCGCDASPATDAGVALASEAAATAQAYAKPLPPPPPPALAPPIARDPTLTGTILDVLA